MNSSFLLKYQRPVLTLTYIIAVTQWPYFGKQWAEVSPNIKLSRLAPSYAFEYLHEAIK